MVGYGSWAGKSSDNYRFQARGKLHSSRQRRNEFQRGLPKKGNDSHPEQVHHVQKMCTSPEIVTEAAARQFCDGNLRCGCTGPENCVFVCQISGPSSDRGNNTVIGCLISHIPHMSFGQLKQQFKAHRIMIPYAGGTLSSILSNHCPIT